MYKLNKNSRSARFYKWVWNKDVTEYKNMCPYFWKYVATLIFIVPILIAKFIVYLIPKGEKTDKVFKTVAESSVGKSTVKICNNIASKKKFWDVVGKILKYTYFIILGALILVFLIFVVIKLFQYPSLWFEIFGIGCFTILCIWGIVSIFVNFWDNIKTPFVWTGRMFKATYKNMCPLIKWEEK